VDKKGKAIYQLRTENIKEFFIILQFCQQVGQVLSFSLGLPPFLDGSPNPIVRGRGRQVTFTKKLDNKGFRRKLLKNFLTLLKEI